MVEIARYYDPQKRRYFRKTKMRRFCFLALVRMEKTMRFGVSIFIILLASFSWNFLTVASADTSLETNSLDLIGNAVFEVVVLKPTLDSLSYESPLPLHLLPYAIRTDKYYPIGSAFAISPTEVVSAAHVMNLGVESQFKEAYIRDKDGNVYGIDKILKYSERRDFVVFSLKDKALKQFLPINTKLRINQKIYAVGNALGEGIVIRDGLYTSNTPEEEEGEWKWIRFSAAASPGNSGGPLLDKDGKVIGIVLQKSPNENLNFALPMAEVINAKSDVAVAYKPMKYVLDNILATKWGTLKNNILLPKSYQELNRELIESTNHFSYNLLKSLFKEKKDTIFPNGNGASILLHSNYDAVFPGLISQKEGGNWYVAYPEKIKDADLGNNGYLRYGNVGHSLLLYIRPPDDISLENIYNDPKFFMELLLKGVYLPRQIGPEKIRITSLGKAVEDYVFKDSYGRKWLVRSYLLEYSDEKVVTVSLPVPGGCVTILMAGQTGLAGDGYIPDLKVLTNFIYVSYSGAFKQWEEFLRLKAILPAVFLSTEISFDYNKAFHYKSKRLSFSYTPDVMEISEKSQLKLNLDYFKENGATEWDVGSIFVGENKNNETYFSIARKMRPPKELGDTYQAEWDAVADKKFPFNKTVYHRDKTTNMAAVFKKPDAASGPVIYSVASSREGNIDQKEMESTLNRFMENLTVYEDGQNSDLSYGDTKAAYHDKGEYFQAVWDREKIGGMNPHTAAGLLLRGDVYMDKGDFDSAFIDYGKAIEINPGYARSYLGKDFMSPIYGARGLFKEAKAETERILESDPLNLSAGPLLKVAEDAVNQKIKNETAVHLFKGEALGHLGRSDGAFAEYNAAIESSPDYSIAYDIRGIANVFKNDIDKAISDYNKAIDLDPKDVIAYNRRGVAYKIKKDYDQAIDNYTKAIELNPSYVKALKNRGNTFNFKGDYDRAIADYAAALQIYPLFCDAYYDRAISFHNKGLYDRAIEDYGKAIEINLKYVDAYFGRGNSCLAKGQYDLSIADYNRSLELDPSNAAVYNNRGIAYQRKGELDKAIADHSRAIEINPGYSDAYNSRGFSYSLKGDLEQAIMDYGQAIKLKSDNYTAYYNRALSYKTRKEQNLAISDYSKTIEINPKHAQAYFGRGVAYQDRKEPDRALSDYNKAIEINPNYSEAYNNRGIIYWNKGDLDEAISDYGKAIEMDPKNDKAYNNRGAAYYRKGELERAIADYSKAIEINSNYEAAYGNRGAAYKNKGALDNALSDYSKAIEINPTKVETYKDRGSVYASKGKFQLAFSDFSKALEINPRYEPAYNERGIAYGRKGEYDLAISDFNKAIEIEPENFEAYNNRGFTFKLKGDHDRAISDFNEAIKINPKHVLSFINRGNTFAEKKNRNNACSDWKQACIFGSCESITRAKKSRYCSDSDGQAEDRKGPIY